LRASWGDGVRQLLFLSHRMPYPPDKGDKIRSWNMLRYLTERYQVHLGCFVDDPADWCHVGRLEALCGHCHFARLNASRAKLRSLAGLYRGEALSLPYYRDAGLARWVRALAADNGLDGVVVFSSAMAQYASEPPLDGIRRIVDFVDVDSRKWRQFAETQSRPLRWIYEREARRLLDHDRAVAGAFDAGLFVSRAEAEIFRKLAPEAADKIHHIDNGVDTATFSPDRDYENPYEDATINVVFTGTMDYWPNVQAVIWFADQVWPRVHSAIPAARFVIVGAKPVPAVSSLARRPGIAVTGRVPDIRPYLAHGAVAVVPSRFSPGVQNKILEAMAMARPVLATPRALEGLDVEAGREVLVAADAGDFGAALTALLTSGEPPDLGGRARARVRASYDWATCLSGLSVLLEDTSAPSKHGWI
jgi:sugar transferase (PEP-CTERM/EpsH1 system associated)